MGCKYAKCDTDTGRYDCKVSGDECVYLIPNYGTCLEDEFLDNDDCLEEIKNE